MHYGDFSVYYEPICGISMHPDPLCNEMEDSEYWVWINPDRCTTELEELDTLIHELLHCEHPNMSEKDVTRTASHIAKVLKGEGWGKIPKKKKKKKKGDK